MPSLRSANPISRNFHAYHSLAWEQGDYQGVIESDPIGVKIRKDELSMRNVHMRSASGFSTGMKSFTPFSGAPGRRSQGNRANARVKPFHR